MKQNGVKTSMDGKGHLKAYSSGREAKAGLDAYFFSTTTKDPTRPWATGRRRRRSTEIQGHLISGNYFCRLTTTRIAGFA